jgi:hypothetical protein
MLHCPVVSRVWVPVGRMMTGPAPQISPPLVGFFGEKKRLSVVSLRPN